MHIQMCLKMADAQLPLKFSDIGDCRSKFVCVDSLARKEPIKFTLLRYEALAKTCSVSMHAIEDPLRFRFLNVRELKFAGKLQHVFWTRILIELGGFCEAHTLATLVRFNLIRRERLDFTFLLSGIRSVTCLCCSANAEHGQEQETLSRNAHDQPPIGESSVVCLRTTLPFYANPGASRLRPVSSSSGSP